MRTEFSNLSNKEFLLHLMSLYPANSLILEMINRLKEMVRAD